MNTKLFAATAVSVLLMTGCRPKCDCDVKISESFFGHKVKADPKEVHVPEKCPKFTVSWHTDDSQPWLAHFPDKAPCPDLKTYQNGKITTCTFDPARMDPSYRYFAFYASDTAEDPDICRGKNCPAIHSLLLNFEGICVDLDNGSPTLCGTSRPASSITVRTGDAITWTLPRNATVHFLEEKTPCIESEGATIKADSPYCVIAGKDDHYRYQASNTGAAVFEIVVQGQR